MKIFTKILIVIIVIAGFTTISKYQSVFNSSQPVLPDKYRIICSLEGKYALIFPGGRKSASIWETEKRAIDFAIYWEKTKAVPFTSESDKYTWMDCDNIVDEDIEKTSVSQSEESDKDIQPSLSYQFKGPNTGMSGSGTMVDIVAGGEMLITIRSTGKIEGSDGRTIGWLNTYETEKFNTHWNIK